MTKKTILTFISGMATIILPGIGFVAWYSKEVPQRWDNFKEVFLGEITPRDLAGSSLGVLPTPDQLTSPTPQCPLFRFDATTRDLDTSLYEHIGGGIYRAKPQAETGFPTPDIWLVHTMPVVFSSMSFSAEIIDSASTSFTPTLTLSLGKTQRVFQFSIGDGGETNVGLDYRSVDGWIRYPQGKNLSEPLKSGTVPTVIVNALYRGTNQIEFTLRLKYIGESGEWRDDKFQYVVGLADASPAGPAGAYARENFGFGVAAGAAIRPISFQFCP